jgi:hypothetical protein
MLINILKTCTSRKIRKKRFEKIKGKYLEEAIRSIRSKKEIKKVKDEWLKNRFNLV